MALCFYYGVFYVESCLYLCSRVSSVLFSIMIAPLGEELAYILEVHLYAYFARVNFFSFFLPLGVRDLLRIVIVALHGIFV